MLTLENRVENLERCYRDVTDAIPVLHKLDKAIMGYWDEDLNIFVSGIVQKVEAMANGKAIGRKRIWVALGVIKDVAVGLLTIFLVWKFGLK